MSQDKEHEITEIKNRLAYVITTGDISDSEKIEILKKALGIIEQSEVEGDEQ